MSLRKGSTDVIGLPLWYIVAALALVAIFLFLMGMLTMFKGWSLL